MGYEEEDSEAGDDKSVKTQRNEPYKPKDGSSESDILRSSNLLENNLNSLVSYLKNQNVKEEVRSYIEYILGLVKNDSQIKQIQLEAAEKKASDNLKQVKENSRKAQAFKKKYKKCKDQHRVLLEKLSQFEASLSQKKSENEQTVKIFRDIVARELSSVNLYTK